MMNKLRLNELEDEDAELVQIVIIKGFVKGQGKGSWNNFAAVGTWHQPLKPLTDVSAADRYKHLDDLPKSEEPTGVKRESTDRPHDVPGDEAGTSSGSRDTLSWLFMSSRNEWITGVYDPEVAPKVLVRGQHNAWWYILHRLFLHIFQSLPTDLKTLTLKRQCLVDHRIPSSNGVKQRFNQRPAPKNLLLLLPCLLRKLK